MYCYDFFKMLQGVFYLRVLHLNACLQGEGGKEEKTAMIPILTHSFTLHLISPLCNTENNPMQVLCSLINVCKICLRCLKERCYRK